MYLLYIVGIHVNSPDGLDLECSVVISKDIS